MTDTITPEITAEPVAPSDPTLDLLFALEVGDTLTVTKDHITRTVTVTAVMDADTSPYILAADESGPIGFDRATIAHGIVEVSL